MTWIGSTVATISVVLIATVVVSVITVCLCRKRANKLQQQDVYYCNSEVDLPPLPPRNTTRTDPQYWTITNAEESQTKPSILQSANDTDCQPRATCHNYAVLEQDLNLSCTAVTSDGLSRNNANPDVPTI